MKKKSLLSEVRRMQKIAGLLKENDQEDLDKFLARVYGSPTTPEEEAERKKILDIVQDNYGISDAVQEFLGWSAKAAENADGTNWDDVVDAIMGDPERKADILGQDND